MANSIAAGDEPVVFEREGAIYANSRDVAAFFEKRHDHVLRDIDNMLKQIDSPDLGSSLFAEQAAPDGNGIERRTFDMTRDGFTLLVMGYDGQKAIRFKLAYLARFSAMEEALRGPVALPDLSDPKVLQQLLADHVGKRIDAERRALTAERLVEHAKPKVDGFDRIASATGSMSVSEADKALQCTRIKDLFDWLHANKWTFRRNGNKNWMAHHDVIRQGYIEHKVKTVADTVNGGDKVVEQVMVTPAGLAKLALVLGPNAVTGKPKRRAKPDEPELSLH
jgi:Rha family phage regulatory protein